MQYDESKPMAVERLYDMLIKYDEVEAIVLKLSSVRPPIDKDYDPETLLFRNHITSR